MGGGHGAGGDAFVAGMVVVVGAGGRGGSHVA